MYNELPTQAQKDAAIINYKSQIEKLKDMMSGRKLLMESADQFAEFSKTLTDSVISRDQAMREYVSVNCVGGSSQQNSTASKLMEAVTSNIENTKILLKHQVEYNALVRKFDIDFIKELESQIEALSKDLEIIESMDVMPDYEPSARTIN